MDKAEQPTTQGDELLREIFLHGHSEGWTGNQTRRDVQHADAEKGWSLYVSNGALEKTKARHRTTSLAAQDDPIEHVASTNSMYQVMDVEGLNRWREHASEGGGHDMASLNKNSLRRLIGTIDKLAAMVSAPSLAAQDGLVEAAERALNYLANTENEFGIALGCAEALREALSAIKEQHHD